MMCKMQCKRNVEILCLNCGFEKHSIAGVAHQYAEPHLHYVWPTKLMALKDLMSWENKQSTGIACGECPSGMWMNQNACTKCSSWSVAPRQPWLVTIIPKGNLAGECLPGRNSIGNPLWCILSFNVVGVVFFVFF